MCIFETGKYVKSLLPGRAHCLRAWWVLKNRKYEDLIPRLLCSFTQETLLNTGAEQLVATTRRRLAMVHTHLTLTHQEELNRIDSTPPREETWKTDEGHRQRGEIRVFKKKKWLTHLYINIILDNHSHSFKLQPTEWLELWKKHIYTHLFHDYIWQKSPLHMLAETNACWKRTSCLLKREIMELG